MLITKARDRSCAHLLPTPLLSKLTAVNAGREKFQEKIPVSPKEGEGIAQGLPLLPEG